MSEYIQGGVIRRRRLKRQSVIALRRLTARVMRDAEPGLEVAIMGTMLAGLASFSGVGVPPSSQLSGRSDKRIVRSLLSDIIRRDPRPIVLFVMMRGMDRGLRFSGLRLLNSQSLSTRFRWTYRLFVDWYLMDYLPAVKLGGEPRTREEAVIRKVRRAIGAAAERSGRVNSVAMWQSVKQGAFQAGLPKPENKGEALGEMLVLLRNRPELIRTRSDGEGRMVLPSNSVRDALLKEHGLSRPRPAWKKGQSEEERKKQSGKAWAPLRPKSLYAPVGRPGSTRCLADTLEDPNSNLDRDRLGSLKRLSRLVVLAGLGEREAAMLRLSASMEPPPERYGGREHARRLTDLGFPISDRGLAKMWGRVTRAFGPLEPIAL